MEVLVENYHDFLAIVVAEINIGAILRCKVHQLAVMNDAGIFSPDQQMAHEFLCFFLTFAQPPTRKRIDTVTLPSTGKIRPYFAINALPGAGHQYFCAVKKLRDTAHGRQIDHCHLIERVVLSQFGEDPAGIVIPLKNHQVAWLRIEKIIGDGFVQFTETSAILFLAHQALA